MCFLCAIFLSVARILPLYPILNIQKSDGVVLSVDAAIQRSAELVANRFLARTAFSSRVGAFKLAMTAR
ncbi:MAG: hypothetical protein DMG30_00075 [Acidobacteria bacterium]|nr:MAG: hypothetical protein DMG30_00075 [Acidobacteriota bacterium]